MASTALTTPIRRRLSTFAKGIASPFTDSRRRNFITDMVTGLVVAGHVHLTAVARGISRGGGNIHATEKRLSRNLASGHWEADPIADALLRRSAALVTDDTLIIGDTTDLAKYHARHPEGLGRGHDGSDPGGRLAPGYCVFEAYVRVGAWQLLPLVVEPLKVYAGAAAGENGELLRHILRAHEAAGKKGTWVPDRGFDRRELYAPLAERAVAFVVRQRGDRTVRTADGRDVTVSALVAEPVCPCPRPWPRGGASVAVEVWLPEVGPDPFLLVIGWRVPGSERPLVLLVSPAAGSNGEMVRARVPPAVGCGDVPSRLPLKPGVGLPAANRLSSTQRRCSNWPRGAGNGSPTPMEPIHARPAPTRRSPPRLTPPSSPANNPPPVWAHLPADRQQQLRDLLGQLLARLHAANARKEAGHE